eukprot:TRINITY_DN151_c0_g1_i2.p1 TRINITY_DN151_c0_g1~~TRINITY_DN151_c0_g1_i2.p1  ORF type:complete len:559 (-),score=313.00 TRINITY_DN151_c0_g1_i2:176-1795(-)
MKVALVLLLSLAAVFAAESELEVDTLLTKTAESAFGQELLTQLKSTIQNSVDAGGPIDKLLKLIDDVRQKTLKDKAAKEKQCSGQASDIHTQINKDEAEISKIKAQIKDLSIKISKEGAEIRGQDNKVKSLIHQTRSLDEKISEHNQELIQGEAKFDDHKSELEKQISEIKGLIELLKNIAVKLATNNMVEQAAEIKVQAGQAAQKAAKTGSSSVQLAAALLQTAAEVDEAAQVEGDMNDFKKLLAMLRTELEKNLRDLEHELEGAISNWNSDKTNLNKQKTSLQNLLAQSKNELSTSQKLKGQALSRLSDAKKQQGSLKPLLANMQNQVAAAEKQLRDHMRECAAAAADFAKQLKVLDDIEKMLRLKHKTLSKGLLNKIENVDLPPVWIEGTWGPCQAKCGTGVRTRKVTCSSKTTACAGRRPISSQPCFEKACPTRAPLAFLDDDDADAAFDSREESAYEARYAAGDRSAAFLKAYNAWQDPNATNAIDGSNENQWINKEQDLMRKGVNVGIATDPPTVPPSDSNATSAPASAPASA